jgi:hypothetical protein
VADVDFQRLVAFLGRVPAIGSGTIGRGVTDDGRWWAKFHIDVDHRFAWRVVQELGHVLNHMSLNERLPTVFKPVSPPAYLNGGPRQFLSWVVECQEPSFSPSTCAEWLEGRLPRPVDDEAQWMVGDEDDE